MKEIKLQSILICFLTNVTLPFSSGGCCSLLPFQEHDFHLGSTKCLLAEARTMSNWSLSAITTWLRYNVYTLRLNESVTSRFCTYNIWIICIDWNLATSSFHDLYKKRTHIWCSWPKRQIFVVVVCFFHFFRYLLGFLLNNVFFIFSQNIYLGKNQIIGQLLGQNCFHVREEAVECSWKSS